MWLEVRWKKLFVVYPGDYPSNEKTAAYAWAQARNEEPAPYMYHPVGEWVDSKEVFSDALKRAREDLDTEDPTLNHAVLERFRPATSKWGEKGAAVYDVDVWRILFLERPTHALGYEYVYFAVNGSYIDRISYHTVP